MLVPRPLITDIAHGRCLPFIGAGFSKNAVLSPGSLMPDWNELAKILAEDAGVAPDLPPPAIAERYERRFGRVQLIEAIRSALSAGDPRPGEAHLSLVDLPFETVYTTNFDLLLEDAYREKRRPFRSLVGELQMPFHAGQVACNIVKMHGDLRHEEHITVTQHDYDRFLSKYPVVATHLSAMLITRTPFFIGYSLTDPDFQNIRKVIKSRLGKFERMSFVIQFNQTAEVIEASLSDHIHVISIDDQPGKTRTQLLRELFDEILSQLDTRASVKLRASRPDAFEPIVTLPSAMTLEVAAPVVEATSTLCFVMMPFEPELEVVYRQLIRPIVEGNGLEPLRADEMSAPGSIMEQIRAAIQQSRLCIADLTYKNPNVLYELGLARAIEKPTILMSRSTEDLPFDVRGERVIVYGDDIISAWDTLERAIHHVLFDEKIEQSHDLFLAGHFRASIAAAAVVLEHHLRDLVRQALPAKISSSPRTLSPRASIDELVRAGVLEVDDADLLREAVKIRNDAVHQIREPSQADADFVLGVVQSFVGGNSSGTETKKRRKNRPRS